MNIVVGVDLDLHPVLLLCFVQATKKMWGAD